MKNVKVWPHLTIVALVCAVAAGLGVALWMKNERTAQAEELPPAARIQRVEGEVALNDSLGTGQDNPEWIAATVNQPYSVGDRIYTRDNSSASVAFTGRNFARLEPNTSLDLISFDNARTQVALREGSALFDLGYLEPNQLFEVATPYGAVDLQQPGLYNVGFDNDGNVLISVLSGLAQVVGLAGSGEISKGEMLTLLGSTAAQVALSRLDGRDAGYFVDDYYRYQYPNVYDGRYVNYDAYLNDPFYYDPYRRYPSYQYAYSGMPGLYDLDNYGDWQNIDGYGYAWRPRVDAGWVPYQQGYWMNDYPYGPTWVSTEPWGYAPYHYGRWANVGNQWYWIPDRANTTPLYSPALVAFVPLNDANQIGWVPLAPGDPYVPRYYDANWQPHYLVRGDVMPTQLVNLGIPGAVSVLPLDQWGRPIDRGRIQRVDGTVLANVRPTLEPLLLTPLRNAAINSAWGRGKIDIPPGIAKKLDERQVFVRDVPSSPRFGKNLPKTLRVQNVPNDKKQQKFQVVEAGSNRAAVKEARKLEQQQRHTENEQRKLHAEQERAARKAVQQPQAQPVANPVRPATSRGRVDVPRNREPQKNMEPPRQRQPQMRQDVPQPSQAQPRAQPQPRVANPKPDRGAGKAPAPSAGGGNQGGQGGGKAKGKGKG